MIITMINKICQQFHPTCVNDRTKQKSQQQPGQNDGMNPIKYDLGNLDDVTDFV